MRFAERGSFDVGRGSAVNESEESHTYPPETTKVLPSIFMITIVAEDDC